MFEDWIGRKETREWTVTRDMLADSMKSGSVPVLATPCMIALMENAALSLVQPALPEGITTVGTAVDIRHLNPTPEGAVIRAEAELTETDGRRFVFKVTVFDEAGVIGEGTHERYSIKSESFERKASARKLP